MDKVRTIIWDCDNVMWFHRKDEPQITAEAMGITEIDEFSAEFYKMFESFMEYFKNKKVNMKETLLLIEREMPILGLYGILPEQYMKIHDKIKLQVNDFNYDTITVMKYLNYKNIKCIVKSDWWWSAQVGIMKHYGVIDYIEEIHCCDNAYLKSNPLSAKGVVKKGKEEEYLIIGDSLTSDIAFAKHTGIGSIWLNRNNEENKTIYNPNFEITSLLEVMDII